MVEMYADVGMTEATRILREMAIPVCPPVLADLMQEARHVHPDITWIIRLILQDAELSAAVLKSVNSPLYGLRRKIATVRAALDTMGLRWCTNLVAGTLLRRALVSSGAPSMDSYWESLTERGVIIAYLARELGVAEFDDAHTFGLFRDGGAPLMVTKFPDYASWFEVAEVDGVRNITQMERARYGIDHASIGSMLAKTWFLPKYIWLPISLHHLRDEILVSAYPHDDLTRRLIAIGALADCLSGLHRTPRSSEYWEREQQRAYRALGVQPEQLSSLRADVSLLLESP